MFVTKPADDTIPLVSSRHPDAELEGFRLNEDDNSKFHVAKHPLTHIKLKEELPKELVLPAVSALSMSIQHFHRTDLDRLSSDSIEKCLHSMWHGLS